MSKETRVAFIRHAFKFFATFNTQSPLQEAP